MPSLLVSPLTKPSAASAGAAAQSRPAARPATLPAIHLHFVIAALPPRLRPCRMSRLLARFRDGGDAARADIPFLGGDLLEDHPDRVLGQLGDLADRLGDAARDFILPLLRVARQYPDADEGHGA